MSNLKKLVASDFKMIRLSDVIDLGAIEGSFKNDVTETDKGNLDRLKDLIEQFKRIAIGEFKKEVKTPEEDSGKGEPLDIAKVNLKQESKKKLLTDSEYTRNRLLMLAASPASKLPPLRWDQVQKEVTLYPRKPKSPSPVQPL